MSPRNQYQPAVSSNSDLDARLRGLPVIGENETALSGTTCSTDTGRLSTLFSPNRAMPSATPPMSVGSSIGSAESKLLVVRNRFRRAPTSKTSTHAHSEAGKVAAALYEVQSEYEERGGCPAMRRTDGWVTNAWSKLKFWKVAAKAEGATQDMPKAVVPQLYDLQRAPAQYPQFDALL
ncbi:hypothetical protein BKA62DRAFT_694266 [Auriculariales sp. MPI-PUGE-AT-0066]|nr:hypothetical protein BKA62DRAFT_694266 [Auriculariales sp. MPI-PUGE-AT-0066]